LSPRRQPGSGQPQSLVRAYGDAVWAGPNTRRGLFRTTGPPIFGTFYPISGGRCFRMDDTLVRQRVSRYYRLAVWISCSI